jgi:hypothetical protein
VRRCTAGSTAVCVDHRGRCGERGEVVNGAWVQNFMDFGPGSNIQIHLGQGEALIDLALPAGFEADLAAYVLHPALLDMATGAAQKLILVCGSDDFYVPFSYGRVLVTRPLPPTFSSHVRLRAAEGKRRSLTRGCSMQKAMSLSRSSGTSCAESRRSLRNPFVQACAADGPETAEEGFLREGMTNAEGLEASIDPSLQRIAAGRSLYSTSISGWIASSMAVVELRPRTPIGPLERPVSCAPAAMPALERSRDEIERDLAAI